MVKLALALFLTICKLTVNWFYKHNLNFWIFNSVVVKTNGACQGLSNPNRQCPAPNPTLRCIQCKDDCSKDSDCQTTSPTGGANNEICCPQPGCGNYCTVPVKLPPRPPTSCNQPITNPSHRCPARCRPCFVCNDECKSDSDCPTVITLHGHRQVCCRVRGCGNQCLSPVVVG